MTAADEGPPWHPTPGDDAVMVTFLQSGSQTAPVTGHLQVLAATSDTGEAVVAARMTDRPSGTSVLHLRHFSRLHGTWMCAGGTAVPYPDDIKDFAQTRDATTSTRVLDISFMASLEDGTDDLCLITLAQTRPLPGRTATLRHGAHEQPLQIGVDGLVPVLVRLPRGQSFPLHLLVHDGAGRLVSTSPV